MRKREGGFSLVAPKRVQPEAHAPLVGVKEENAGRVGGYLNLPKHEKAAERRKRKEKGRGAPCLRKGIPAFKLKH